MMQPKMRRIMQKLKNDDAEYYFDLCDDDKEIVTKQIATTVVNETINLINNYTSEEFGSILELSIRNLQSLLEHFVETEMYAQAQMMKDTILLIESDLEHIKLNEDTIS
jgi:hypothetical protein